MTHIFRIDNTIQHYDWGSPDFIPDLMSLKNPAKMPFAELWMGAHPSASSTARLHGNDVPLNALIKNTPEAMIGQQCALAFGAKLPFLFKLLAAGRPLSIQAHPDKTQAKAGWIRENERGIPLDSPNRSYKDDNHKPEILCAITPFKALCGFRDIASIRRLLDAFAAPVLIQVRTALDLTPEDEALKLFLSRLNSLPLNQRSALGAYAMDQMEALTARDPENQPLWTLIGELARMDPCDASIIAPLYLNYVELQPGQAIFLPAGILHAYISGFGAELMANSDNVLRGGLTKKHIDTVELLRVLRFAPYAPEVLNPISKEGGIDFYDTPTSEFRLSVLRAKPSDTAKPLSGSTPSIVIVIDGEFEIGCCGTESLRLEKGQSAFVAASAQAPNIAGSGAAFIASVPL